MSTSVLEMPTITYEQARPTTREVVKVHSQVAADPNFTDAEIDSLHRDDAMAAGMITVILSCAFLTLLSLVVGVSLWMLVSA